MSELYDLPERLVDAVRLLSEDSTVQIDWLSSLGLFGLADELALALDGIYTAVAWRWDELGLDDATVVGLEGLHEWLGQMSGEENAHLWTMEALVSSSEWAEVRRRAAELFAVFERQGRRGLGRYDVL